MILYTNTKSEFRRKTCGEVLLRITERIVQSSPALRVSVYIRCKDQSGINAAGGEDIKIA
jgi:hypothetical protein